MEERKTGMEERQEKSGKKNGEKKDKERGEIKEEKCGGKMVRLDHLF